MYFIVDILEAVDFIFLEFASYITVFWFSVYHYGLEIFRKVRRENWVNSGAIDLNVKLMPKVLLLKFMTRQKMKYERRNLEEYLCCHGDRICR